MAEYAGHRQLPEAVYEVQVGVTDAGTAGPDKNLACPRVDNIDIFYREWFVCFLEYGSFHGFPYLLKF